MSSARHPQDVAGPDAQHARIALMILTAPGRPELEGRVLLPLGGEAASSDVVQLFLPESLPPGSVVEITWMAAAVDKG